MKTLFALVAVIPTFACAVDCLAAPVHNNSIFFEHFPGSGTLMPTGNIAQVIGTINVAGSLATTTVDLGGIL